MFRSAKCALCRRRYLYPRYPKVNATTVPSDRRLRRKGCGSSYAGDCCIAHDMAVSLQKMAMSARREVDSNLKAFLPVIADAHLAFERGGLGKTNRGIFLQPAEVYVNVHTPGHGCGL